MGLTAELVSTKYGIGREAQDEFSYNSHQKAIAAIEAGKFKDEIVPVEVEEVYYDAGKKKSRKFTVAQDEGPRKDTTKEVLAGLKPVLKLVELLPLVTLLKLRTEQPCNCNEREIGQGIET